MQKNLTIKYRPDIDGLRAVAVLSVLGYHFFPSLFVGGFVGVDVFFVISGYLISRIILGSLERGQFSFAEFYARRVRRIFPALIIVLLSSGFLGWFFLLPDEYRQVGKHIASGAGFVSNLVRWRESGYFDTAAETKPLLHLWSLAVEEQFYIFWPLILYSAFRLRCNRFAVISFVAILSFLLNLRLMATDALGMFYLPVSRFWELLLGAVLAQLSLHSSESRSSGFSSFFANRGALLKNAAGLFGLICILGSVFFLSTESSFPGYHALLPTLGAVCMIGAGSGSWVNQNILSKKGAVAIGIISYPLYLWHWPLLTFCRIVVGDLPPVALRCAALGASFFLGWATYRYAELPFKESRYSPSKSVWFLSLGLVLVALFGVAIWRTSSVSPRLASSPLTKSFSAQVEWLWWDDAQCVERFKLSPCQVDSEQPEVMLLGDSHANALYPALIELRPGVVHAGTCPPMHKVIGYSTQNKAGSAPCFDSSYLDFRIGVLARLPSIKVVVLSAYWGLPLSGLYSNPGDTELFGSYQLESLLPSEKKLGRGDLMFEGLSRTIELVSGMNKKAIFVRGIPELVNDIRVECTIDRFAGLWKPDCAVPFEQSLPFRSLETELVSKLVKRFPDLVVVDPVPSFCEDGQCFFIRNNDVLYRDRHHLSLRGSRLIAPLLLPHLK
jgi:peptidoglycan/LPS O-acetylase OafA/YrhL